MASIRFIPGSGYRIEWHVTVRHGPNKREKPYRGSRLIRCKKKTQFYRALAMQVKAQREKEAAELVAGITKPVVPWDEFLEEYQREKQYQKTIEIAVKRLIELGEFAGFKTVNEFTGAAITRYIDHKRKAGSQPPTVRKILNDISAAMTYANNKKYLADHPFRTKEIQLPPKSKPRERFLSRDDFAKFLRTCRSMPETGGMMGRDRYHAMRFAWHCIFIVNTGLRITEYITAKKTELLTDRLTVHGKGKRGQLKKRTVPMNHFAKWALKHLTQNQTKEDLVFPYCNRRSWYTKYRRWFGRAGFANVGPHVLRHTFGTWLTMAGVPLADISKVMGHISIQTTITGYSHLTPDYLQNATIRMKPRKR